MPRTGRTEVLGFVAVVKPSVAFYGDDINAREHDYAVSNKETQRS